MDTFVNSNRLFAAFFCLSLFLHYIMITAAPIEKIFKAGTPLLYDDSVKESDRAPVEFELEATPEASNIKEKVPLQEKRLSFVDTSDSPLDEEPQGDTDKIGVKAMVARDTYEGEEGYNNQPHSEGNSEGLFLSKGELPFAETSGLGEQNEPMDLASEDLRELERPERVQEFKSSRVQETLGPETLEPLNPEREDREGLEHVENPSALAQPLIKSGASEIKSIETPPELEDEGEIVPLVTPPQSQKMSKGAQEVIKRDIPDIQKEIQTSAGKKINRGARKGSPVIYEDTISNAQLQGDESFSVQKHEYAEYFQHIRDRIGLYWYLSYGHDQAIKLETRNRLPIIIEFKILPSGRTDEVEIIDEAGNPLLASRIQSSIQGTRLNKFPPYVKEDFIAVRFNFYFF